MDTDPASENLERRLFDDALDMPAGAERDAWLAGACRGAEPLRLRLQALLRVQAKESQFLPECPPTIVTPPSEQPGEMIGRYKLLQEIGEGGFGTVWMAEQTEPVTRRVALKIIKLGMDTREVIARFEAERQALAMMDHPNIAKVLDAGATDKGRPFFVMELVKGVPITQYCDEAGLGTRERLALFGDVCSAINHAHQKGVIHRDIKPSNVMVTLYADKPVVKVIDFGIAKATQSKLTDKTLFTRFEQFIGTPVYMSPEQAAISAVDIDTRSDIYALGILLYELLTGKPPFDAKSLASAGYEEMRRIIREVEPPKPSSRLSTVAGEERTQLAKARHIEPEKLNRLVEPDLDWIVMKAIEKDRTRRYDTANGLALDIQRFLADEPVSATPPSVGYQFRKFARRNKAALRVAAAIAAVLVAATAVSLWQAVRATQAEKKTATERDAKELARQDAEAISKFLGEVFQSPDPARDGRTITVAETLDKAAKKLETDLANQPARQAKLQATLGSTYSALGLAQQAIPLQEKARDYYLASVGPQHRSALAVMNNLANSYDAASRRDEALKLREEVLSLRRKVNGPEHPATIIPIYNLANSYAAAGRKDEALKLREEALSLSRKVNGPEHRDTLGVMSNLAMSYAKMDRLPEAVALQEQALATKRRVLPPNDPFLAVALGQMASLYEKTGRRDEALKLREEVLSLRRKVNGPEDRETLGAMSNLAGSYFAVGRLSEAVTLEEQALAAKRRVLPPNDPFLAAALGNLALLYEKTGRRDEALKLFEEVLALRRKVSGPEHSETLTAMNNLADAYMTGRDYAKAEPLLSDLLAHARKSAGTNSSELESRLGDMAELRYRQKRYADAETLYRERIESGLRQPGGETSDTVLGARASLGRLYSDWAWAERTTAGAAMHQRAIEGEKLLRETIAVREADAKWSAWRKAELHSRLGGALSVLAFTDPGLTATTREPKLVEAESTLQRGQAGMEQDENTETKYRRDGIERFIRLYEAWPKPNQLPEWKQKLAAFDEAGAEQKDAADKTSASRAQ